MTVPREPRRVSCERRRGCTRCRTRRRPSEHGLPSARRELEVDPPHLHVIPHGAFTCLRARARRCRPSSRRARRAPVRSVLRPDAPQKGIDVLLEAWRGIQDAELWIVGCRRWTSARCACRAAGVRFVSRFVGDHEVAGVSAAPTSSSCPTARSTSPACCHRARLRAAAAAERRRGFPRSPPGRGRGPARRSRRPSRRAGGAVADPSAPRAARRLAAAAAGAGGPYSWDAIAAQWHLALYERLAGA